MRILKHLRLGRLGRERRGSMLTEFALVLPGFFLILFTGLAVSDALSAYNRIQNVATTVGITVSRLQVISNEDIVGIASAARGHMFPFPSDQLSILVVALWVDDTGAADIVWCERWSRTSGASGICTGNPAVGGSTMGYWEWGDNIEISDLNPPSEVLTPNTGIVMARIKYHWIAPFGRLFAAGLGEMPMTDTFFYSPRADVTLVPPARARDSDEPTDTYEVRP